MKVLPDGARLHIVVVAAALVTFSGCSHGHGHPPIEGSEPSSLANPAGGRSDVLEREQMRMKVGSMEELLTSGLSGVVIRRNRGNTWIELRGPTSFSSNTEALIIIDGVQNSTRGLLAMNPEHVQRIQLLKGASASAYGLRGGNGVVLVTTRRYAQ